MPKLYGGTDPLNRDSDNDGAIDGGESNIYPGTPIDIDGDGVIDSGKQIDLNGDGIIEMGEENYYETDPNEYTYIVDVFVVVDEEYKLLMWRPGNTDRWKDISTGAINKASEYFLSTYQVKLNISQIDDSWDSDDTEVDSNILLKEVEYEMKWIGSDKGTDNHNSDILVAFTGQNPYLDSKLFGDYLGRAHPQNATCINRIPPSIGFERSLSVNLVQHEISHLFGTHDHDDDRYCIMDKTYPWPMGDGRIIGMGNIWTTHEWGSECLNITELNKLEVSHFKEGGDYNIIN